MSSKDSASKAPGGGASKKPGEKPASGDFSKLIKAQCETVVKMFEVMFPDQKAKSPKVRKDCEKNVKKIVDIEMQDKENLVGGVPMVLWSAKCREDPNWCQKLMKEMMGKANGDKQRAMNLMSGIKPVKLSKSEEAKIKEECHGNVTLCAQLTEKLILQKQKEQLNLVKQRAGQAGTDQSQIGLIIGVFIGLIILGIAGCLIYVIFFKKSTSKGARSSQSKSKKSSRSKSKRRSIKSKSANKSGSRMSKGKSKRSGKSKKNSKSKKGSSKSSKKK